MFQCQIELLLNIIPDEQEPDYIVVARYNFEPPNLRNGEEVHVTWKIWDKLYHLNCKVVNRKTEIFSKGTYPENREVDVFLLRIFVETEDREDKLQEIKEKLLALNPHLRKQEG
jgi:hypothetical protein